MRCAVFNTKPYDRKFLAAEAERVGGEWQLVFLEPLLTAETARLADGFPAVCAFVNDQLDAPVLEALAAGGTKFVALRCAGFNNVDLAAAARLGIRVARVPAYSPYAVAEHAVGMMLTLNRKFHKAYNRVREGNFALDGLLGFDMHGRTAGVVGTGKIGECTARILAGFGCKLLAYDPYENPAMSKLGASYVSLEELLAASDVVTLHCPLTPATHHLINGERLKLMKRGAMLINTGRGALLDTRAVVAALKSERLGSLGIDVYEEEGDLFFVDHSDHAILDDVFSRLLTFPNVLATGHQAFFTQEALEAIARQTVANLQEFAAGTKLTNEVKA
ncbi:MAG: 2-hydroxyacid dehydrogenase [Planctomycetes bacterium]|nr:2-hydroxyacid dehydrogenase [Planctomycetota bacterium]